MDILVSGLIALFSAGAGLWAGERRFRVGRADDKNLRQLEAVAEFLTTHQRLVDEERIGDFFRRGRNEAVEQYPGDSKNQGRYLEEYLRFNWEPLWDRFTTAHELLQLRLTDTEVSAAAQEFYDRLAGVRSRGNGGEYVMLGGPPVWATVFSGTHTDGPSNLIKIVKEGLM